MAPCVRDVMTTAPVSVQPETALIDVHRLFVEEEIHGAPVVDDEMIVRGVITSADLLRAVMQEHEAGGSTATYLRGMMEFSGPDWQQMPDDFQDRLGQLQVEEFMTAEVVAVAPDASIPEVAQAMRGNRVHRVLVMDGEKLEGVVSALDLVALLEKQG